MRQGVVRIALLAALFLVSVAGVTQGERIRQVSVPQVRRWLESAARARIYRASAPQLLEIFTEANEARLPLWILFDKLKEAAAKRVPAAKVAPALRLERKRLVQARDLLLAVTDSAEQSLALQRRMKRVAVLLGGGLSPTLIRRVLVRSAETDRSVDDALSACETILGIARSSRLAEETLYDLAAGLLASSLTPRSYGAVTSLFVRAQATGMTAEAVVRMILDVVTDGGGLIQLNQELERRTNRR